ncbi:MAG: excinuclease ABC subunit UvrA [Pirellulales bacterium]|nr:excinuclease ABC subunit UvrA [Pirellulales bacterium]
MSASDIEIRGAREHNLRDVELTIPRNKLVCLTGVSGSGKSSLAFDTLFAEGQRRYVESLSTFARQYLGQMPKPDVDHISGLSPSISISQKTSGQNPRSTVGTITEIYDYLRVLYARVGLGYCPGCSRPITAQSREQIIEQISAFPVSAKFSVLAPLVRGQKGEHKDLLADLLKQGFLRARVDGEVVSLSDDIRLDRQMRHNIEVVIDRLSGAKSHAARLAEAVELALRMGDGNLIVAPAEDTKADAIPPQPDDESDSAPRRSPRNSDLTFSAHYACTHCRRSFEPPSPQLFSFNSPRGMCPSCDGLGQVYSFDVERLIPDPSKSFQQGCFELIGNWRDLGRWRKHIYAGVAETLEYRNELEPGTVLETPWEELDPKLQKALLWGTGDLHITFTWRAGGGQNKYGGAWEGIIPELLEKYRSSKSRMQKRQLEGYMRVIKCGECNGERLNQQARAVKIESAHPKFADAPERSLPEICRLAVSDATDFFSEVVLEGARKKIAEDALKEITGRLGFLYGVGLEYLSLDRTAPTLSGGESQRIRLAGQVGCGLVGVTYILDEPSIGLHPRDNSRLLGTLRQLRDLGNTVVVVEHDEDTMRAADHIVDFGPGPGVRGGEVVAKGAPQDIEQSKRSVTGGFLSGKESIAVPECRRELEDQDKKLRVIGATQNNLKNVDVDLPLGLFVCVTGVSGSGKSSLVNEIIANTLHVELNRGEAEPGACERVEGLEHLDKLIAIDQSPIGRTPRSNPATYIKVFDDIRRLYTQLPEAKTRGYKEGRFSFNVDGGRCEACEGNGSNKLEMDFLADVWVPCPVCEGHRFNRETLQVRYKGKSIADVLEMDIQQALEHFQNIPKIKNKLQTLHDVGLDYVKLGQPSPTLSGGEAQRIKLARELVKRSTGQTLYLLDEPTTGLHFADIRMLLQVLHGFVDAGNTVLVVEHQLDVIKTADWVIDMGPEGGAGGGQMIAAGPPEVVAKNKRSHTGAALAQVLPLVDRENGKPPVAKSLKPRGRASQGFSTKIKVRGAKQHNLRNVDVEVPRDEMTVCCGPSGSGKTSLAMDTIYAEGQRRYVESLSSYARQFVSQMQKPRLDHIEGLSPAIAIEQKNAGHTPRSTVGTVTEIYDYLRILFSRLGEPYCPECDIPIGVQTSDQIVDKVMAHPEGTRLYLMAPVEVAVGSRYESLWEECRAAGYARVRVDGETYSLDDVPKIDRRRKHRVEIVVDRVIVRKESMRRIAESVEQTLSRGAGVMHVAYPDENVAEAKWQVTVHSQHFACDECGRSFEPLAPQHFSFNSMFGWCPACEGLGTQRGANPAALVRDGSLSLAEGALAVWSNAGSPLATAMLTAFCRQTGIPSDVPFNDLTPRHKRIIFRGLADDEWISVPAITAKGKPAKDDAFRFQYKGLYPALEDAANLSTPIRNRLSHLMDEVDCAECGGSRLRDDAAAMRYRGRTIAEYCSMPLGRLVEEVRGWKLDRRDKKVATELIREVRDRLAFLVDVGLEYLTLHRAAPTLSGGEAQRIRLASQVGSGLTGVLYVLDEPTIGLHPRDNLRLISALQKLRDLGNTLLLVEHDREVIDAADQLLDFGPAAGRNGGRITARGKPGDVAKKRASLTGKYLSGVKSIAIPTNRRIAPQQDETKKKPATRKKAAKKKAVTKSDEQSLSTPRERFNWLKIVGARHNNLRDVNAAIPLAAMTVVTGPSGSGKSTLIEEILYKALARTLHRATMIPGSHDAIKGLEFVNKVIRVDQQPLGNSPSSNPATFTGAFELIRQLYAQLPDAKIRGYTPRRFSFNVPGGRCENCEGQGQLRIEMHFLPDVWVECDTCRGQRYNAETLAVRYKDHSIADVLNLEIAKAVELFQNIPKIRRILQTLCDVGLEYLTLGQPAPTLSGGEAQRVKLAAELSRPDTGRTLYLLDEPTTGLHFDDLRKLLDVLNRLVDLGNTVVVIEHNLDIIKNADWVIDLGPEAGSDGGRIVFAGTPEELVAHAETSQRRRNGKSPPKRKTAKASKSPIASKSKSADAGLRSHTGEALAAVLAAGPHETRTVHDFAAEEKRLKGGLDITAVGQGVKMPWEKDGRRWHTVDRVGRKGEPCNWEGEALSAVVEKIHELGEFSNTNWSERTVVEIAAERKSDGWFFHALTGEPWLVKLKFRVASRTFKRDQLIERLGLTPLNDMPDLPVYGGEPRVKCKNLRGPWQEVQLAVHTMEEINHKEFWTFLREAVESFHKATNRISTSPDDVMPWKKLGQKWHFNRRGFPPGKKVQWTMDTLQDLYDLLVETAPGGQFLWNSQQVVHLFIPEQKEPWATLHTKRVDSLHLTLTGPKDRFAMGRIAKLGAGREFKADLADRDQVKIKFRQPDDVHSKALEDFLKEHLQSVQDSTAPAG